MTQQSQEERMPDFQKQIKFFANMSHVGILCMRRQFHLSRSPYEPYVCAVALAASITFPFVNRFVAKG